jgi:YhcH/YjgK/YiaL family protein
MIIDKLENRNLYFGINPNITKALEYIAETDSRKNAAGSHEIDGNIIFTIVSDYITKPRTESYPEAHRIYADVQFVVDGSELFGYTPSKSQKLLKEYETAKDIEFYNTLMSYIRLDAGMFAIVFPNEIHQPGVMVDMPEHVRKVVVKVKM